MVSLPFAVSYFSLCLSVQEAQNWNEWPTFSKHAGPYGLSFCTFIVFLLQPDLPFKLSLILLREFSLGASNPFCNKVEHYIPFREGGTRLLPQICATFEFSSCLSQVGLSVRNKLSTPVSRSWKALCLGGPMPQRVVWAWEAAPGGPMDTAAGQLLRD